MPGFLDTGNKSDCTACGACVQQCPHHAITMEEDEHGFVFPKIVDSRCTHCGLCKKACPVDNSSLQFHPSSEGTAVAGFAKDEGVRAASSSGGFFTGIAKAFWKEGETVAFGAEMLPDISVAHTRADSFDDIAKFRTSKYARSDTGTTFAETKSLLAQGKRVIYSGTPCQIAGLLIFLGGGAEPENLLTVDLVCHGYFSPLFLRKERAYFEKKRGSRAVGYEFRNKDGGHWRDFKAVWIFENGERVETPKSMLPYHVIWSQHLISRESCHACRFSCPHRVSDVTLADYWHVSNDSPLFGENGGTSLILVNTKKGQNLFHDLAEQYYTEPINRFWISSLKYGLHTAGKPHPKRNEALADLRRLSYRRYCRKWVETSRPLIICRIVRRLRRIITNRLNQK